MADDEDQEELELQEGQEQQQEDPGQEQNIIQKTQEIFYKFRLKTILFNVKLSKKTKLEPNQEQTIKKAEKFKNLKTDIQAIRGAVALNRTKMMQKVTVSSTPILKWIIMIGIIFLIAIVILTLMTLTSDAANGGSSAMGVTGKDFYGVRMVYKDDDLASQNMVENYVEYVENGILEAKKITTVDSNTIVWGDSIALPTDEFDYSTFNESEFSTQYAELYVIVFDIAKVVYETDNGSAYAGTTLIDCLNGIKYFGMGDTTQISDNVTDSIVEKLTFSVKDGSNTDVTNSYSSQVKSNVESALTTYYASVANNYALRTEKLFVKDHILEEDDEMVSGVMPENYVAMIFMPKKNVTFSRFSFSVSAEDLTNFKITIKADGSEIVPVTDGYDLDDSETGVRYVYYAKNANVSASAFEDIDSSNLNALKEGMSLFDLTSNLDGYSTYLETSTDENGIEFWKLKQNGVVVEVENDKEFVVVEWETAWQAAS